MWFSGRALAAQARGVLGSTSGDAGFFTFLSLQFNCEARYSEHTGSSNGRGALNGYRRYRDMLKTTFSRFGEVLLIPSYVGPILK